MFFADWTACCNFARDHIENPVSVQGCTLSVHFVLQHMDLESSEVRTLRPLSFNTVPGKKKTTLRTEFKEKSR